MAKKIKNGLSRFERGFEKFEKLLEQLAERVL
jgi:hypothetical protein